MTQPAGKAPLRSGVPSTVKKSKSQSEKAGLTFPVARIARHLKGGRFAKRIGRGAPIFMAAVLEYLTTEVLDLAGNVAKKFERQRITPRYVQLAVRKDDELSKFFENVIIAAGGVCAEQVSYPSSKAVAPRKIKKAEKITGSGKGGRGVLRDSEEDEDDDAGSDRGGMQEDSQQY